LDSLIEFVVLEVCIIPRNIQYTQGPKKQRTVLCAVHASQLTSIGRMTLAFLPVHLLSD